MTLSILVVAFVIMSLYLVVVHKHVDVMVEALLLTIQQIKDEQDAKLEFLHDTAERLDIMMEEYDKSVRRAFPDS